MTYFLAFMFGVIYMKPFKRLKEAIFSDEYSIQHRLLNVILLMMLFAVLVCCVISFALGHDLVSNLVIALGDVLIAVAVYLSVYEKLTSAAVVITCIANLILFPFIYFTSGGMISGMPIWFVLSLVIFWLILKMPYCLIMYLLNAVELVGCMLVEYYQPQYVKSIESREVIMLDIIQCMLVISALLGIIIKYQTYIFTKKSDDLNQQTIELRETMVALERADQAKNEFLANMSHEIRTPINAIMGMNELILSESNSENITRYAQDIKEASGKLLDLVNNILDYSMIESGLMDTKEYTYKATDLLILVNRMVGERIAQKGLEYKQTIDPDVPQYLTGDNYKISRIVGHLLSNAVKYTESGYIALTMSSSKIDDNNVELTISVADTGVGIPKDALGSLFSGFDRIDLKKHRNIEGVGLGLAITKRLVEYMGGTIDAKSIYGSGSVFTVTIPQKIGRAGVHTTVADKSRPEHFAAPKANVLAVDDNKINIEVIKHLLKKYDITADTVLSGNECIELCKNKHYDLIFMDHMMPPPDGIETLKVIQNGDSINRETPVAVVTANAISGAREKYIKEGFEEYIAKPIDIAELEAALLRLLPHRLIEEREAVPQKNTPSVKTDNSEEWIDTKLGLQYLSNDEDTYMEILADYCGQLKRYRRDLADFLKNGDIKSYTVSVHALKSTSQTVGAARFSSMAREQELLAKANDVAGISESFEEFTECLDKVTEAAERILKERDKR